jgi:hypothetical protein
MSVEDDPKALPVPWRARRVAMFVIVVFGDVMPWFEIGAKHAGGEPNKSRGSWAEV